MTDSAAPPPLDELLARREWVRRFARTLARDDATADDLAQDTMLAAIEHPPRDASAPAGWLRRVLTRRAMNRARAERRRDAREARHPGLGAAPSPSDVVGAAESHRRVVEAVLALGEPYRTTVLLRFFEDLPPREVAARMGVPVETVRARVRRAVETLRARLDEEHGGRRAAWLAPLIGTERGRPPATATVAARVAAGAAAAALVLAAGIHLAAPDGGADRRAAAPSASADAAADPSGATALAGAARSGADGDRARAGRRRAQAPADDADRSVADEHPEAPAKWRPYEVRVVDAAGDPVEGVEVRVRRDGEGAWTARTGGDGRTRVSIPAAATVRRVEIADPDAVGGPVSGVTSVTGLAASATIRVERRAWVAGRALGPDGAPLADAIVRWQLPASQSEVATDREGAFRLVVPRASTGTVLLTGRRSFGAPEPGEELVAEALDVGAGRTDVVLVAHRAGRERSLVVRCVDGNGDPVAGATIDLVSTMRRDDTWTQTSGADGRAAFERLPDWRCFVAVRTELESSAPWERDGWATPAGFRLVRPADAEFVLRFEAGRWIRGRVVDEAGAAVARAVVDLALPADRRVRVLAGTDGAFAALVAADVGGAIRVRASPPTFRVESSEDVARLTREQIARTSLRPAERDGVRPGDEGIVLTLRPPAADGR